jgi:hypothetical protein
LSNTNEVTLPATFTLGGEMQKILLFLRRCIAKTIPQLIAAGRAGGTAITIRLSDLSIKVRASSPLITKIGQIQINPRTAMLAIIATNFIPSS